jgi:hypothetical protein
MGREHWDGEGGRFQRAASPCMADRIKKTGSPVAVVDIPGKISLTGGFGGGLGAFTSPGPTMCAGFLHLAEVKA